MKEVMGKVKRTLSILLSVAMVVTCVPQTGLSALAANETPEITEAAGTETAEVNVETPESNSEVTDDADAEDAADGEDSTEVIEEGGEAQTPADDEQAEEPADEADTPAEVEEPAEGEEAEDPAIDAAQKAVMEDETDPPAADPKTLWVSILNSESAKWTLTKVDGLTDGASTTYLTVGTIDTWEGFVGTDGTEYSKDGIKQNELTNKILAFGVEVKSGYKFASDQENEQVKASLMANGEDVRTISAKYVAAVDNGAPAHYEINLGENIAETDFNGSDLNLSVWADVKKTLTKDMITLTGDGVKEDSGAYTVAWNGVGEVKPVVEVKDGEETLVEGTAYTVAYANNDKEGTATVTVTGIGNYTDSATLSFEIVDERVALKDGDSGNCTVTVDVPEAGVQYTGKPIEPAVTVTYKFTDAEGEAKTKTLAEDEDYTVAYEDNEVVGTATVTISGKGDYKGDVEATFEITEADALTALEDTIYADVEADKNGSYDLSALEFKADGEVVTPESYVINQSDTKEGDVLKTGIAVNGSTLTYALADDIDLTNENLEDGKIVISVSFKNYKESSITLTVKAVKKDVLTFKAADVTDKIYTSQAIAYDGKITQIKGGDGDDKEEEVTEGNKLEEVKSYFTYSYKIKDGAAVEAPINAGEYEVTISLTNSKDYRAEDFKAALKIEKAPLTITAKDKAWTVRSGKLSTDATADDYTVTGKLDENALTTAPTTVTYYRINDDGSKGNAVTSDDEWAGLEVGDQLIIELTGAVASGNYDLTVNTGILTVRPDKSTPITTYDVTLHNVDHAGKDVTISVEAGQKIVKEDADAKLAANVDGYSFKGWYKDEACTKAWNFATETVQGNMDLYAVWASAAVADGEEGIILEVRDIPNQSYTGNKIQPNVQVYANGVELKKGKDYTIAYANNTNADTVVADGGYMGRDDTQKGDNKFNDELPYVTITGKGNYAGVKVGKKVVPNVVKKNFHIEKADISDVEGNLAAGFTMKYTDQLVAGTKDLSPFTSLKYKKAMALDKDYSVTIEGNTVLDADGNEVSDYRAEITEVKKKKKAPVITKGYSGNFTLVVEGKGNYTGTLEIPVLVVAAADSSKLLKNAKINLGSKIKSVKFSDYLDDATGEAEVILTAANVVDKKYYKVENGVQADTAEANGNFVFTVSFGKGKNITYLNALTDYDVEFTNNNAVGKATLTITPKTGSDYVGSLSTTFTITGDKFTNGKKGTVKVTGLEGPFPYTGSPITKNSVIEVTTVKTHTEGEGDDAEEVPNKTFTLGQDYTVKYANNIKKGKATVTFTANPESGYTGSFKETFQIGALNLADNESVFVFDTGAVDDPKKVQMAAEDKKSATIKWDTAAEYALAGAQISYRLEDNQGHELVPGTDYTAKYTNNNKVADVATAGKKTPTLTITGKGNYSGKLVIAFSIVKANKLSLVADAAAVQYAAKTKEYKPKITVKNGSKAVAAKEYTVTYDKNKKADVEAYLAALAAGEDVSDLVPTATIKIKSGTSFYTAKAEEYEGTDADWDAAQNTLGPIQLPIYKEKLTAKNCTINLTGNQSQYRYTGKPVTPTVVSVMYGGKDLKASGDVYVSYGANIAAGKNKGTVTVTGTGIYGGSVTKKFNIDTSYIYQPAPAAKTTLTSANTVVTLKLDDTELEKENGKYFAFSDGSAVKPTVEVALKGEGEGAKDTLLKEKDDYTVSYGDNNTVGTDTGSVTITAKGDSDYYEGSFEVKFDIKKAVNKDLANCTVTLYQPGTTAENMNNSNKLDAYQGDDKAADYAITVKEIPETGLEPAVAVMNGDDPLTKDTDYTVTYANNKVPSAAAEEEGGEATVATVTIAPADGSGFKGQKVVKFWITVDDTETPTPGKTDLSGYHVVVSQDNEPITNKESDGSYKVTVNTQPTNGSVLDGVTLVVKTSADEDATIVNKDDYTVTWSYTFAQDATTGTGTATITGTENYTGTITVTFSITVEAEQG